MAIKKGDVEVYLSENVFMGLILSSVEVYKKECFGLLLGYKTPQKYIVEHAVPYQSARRGHKWIELRSDKWKIIQEVLNNFPKLDMIGDFHSHTMYRDVRADVSLSEDDIIHMYPDELQIVIAVNENRRSTAWATSPDNTISGTISGYHFKLAAYYFPTEDNEGEKKNSEVLHTAKIIIPFVIE
ncbi:MAG: hypothetical protein HZA08_11830 [Nitrospirae bacterium]|nr:hypothetical protein [Nitrospirota bacterium]